MFADWVIMGVVVTDVYFKAGAPNSFARIRLATSGPRGRFFVTAWAYGKTAETARDLLRAGSSATLRGYFNPDTSQGARGDALSLIVSHVDVPKVSDYSDGSAQDSAKSPSAPALVVQPNAYEPGEAGKAVENLNRTAQEAQTEAQEREAGGYMCPLRKAPCKQSCTVRETCENVAKSQGK